GLGGGERSEVRDVGGRLRVADDLEPRERLGEIDLQVRVPTPGLAATVVLRLVLADQPRLEHERLELGAAGDPADAGRLGEEVLDLLPRVAVEVALHARAQ